MKIALVNPTWDARARTPDATLDRFRTLTGWADALRAAAAEEVQVFQRFQQSASIDRNGVGYRFVADAGPPSPSGWYAGRALSAAVVAAGPDLVHVNGLDHPRLIRRLRRLLPSTCRILVQDHGGFDPVTLSPLRKAWMRRGLTAADALLVAAPRQIDTFRACGLAPAGLQLRDVVEGSTTLRAVDQVTPRDGLAILFVGRLNANKDPLTVLDGFARFRRDRPDASLSFVYDDAELEPAIRSVLSRDAALASCVTLLGAVPHAQLAGVYARADLFVLGSHRESTGYAAIEAMACGVAPVLTDIPSFHWLSDGGRIGALWRVGDPESLRSAFLVAAAADRRRQRQAALDRFEQHLSWPAIGRRAMAIYREFSRT